MLSARFGPGSRYRVRVRQAWPTASGSRRERGPMASGGGVYSMHVCIYIYMSLYIYIYFFFLGFGSGAHILFGQEDEDRGGREGWLDVLLKS